jgi:hypothetical protein
MRNMSMNANGYGPGRSGLLEHNFPIFAYRELPLLNSSICSGHILKIVIYSLNFTFSLINLRRRIIFGKLRVVQMVKQPHSLFEIERLII